MKKILKSLREKKDLWLGIIGATGVIVAGNWLSDALLGEEVFNHWFPVCASSIWFNVVVSLLLFALFFWLVYSNRYAFLSARSFRYHPCKPRTCLVMMLTFPTPEIKLPEGRLPWILEKKNKETDKASGEPIVIEGKSLLDDTKKLPPFFWNWQQLMRALIPHLNTLKEVRLICSKDKAGRGSHAFAKYAEVLIHNYFSDVAVNIHSESVDFEDFNALKSELNDILKALKKKYSDDEIIIDVTGGQKTASIAAATVTLNSQMNFQYVRTVPFGDVPLNEDVMSYDVRVYSPMSEAG